MMKPTQNQPEPDAWEPFTRALVEAAGTARQSDQLDHLRRAVHTLDLPGEWFVDDEGAGLPDADLEVIIDEKPAGTLRLGWSGNPDDRDRANELLQRAAQALRPLLAAWATLRRESGLDGLTGAGNRRALDEQLPTHMSFAVRHEIPFSVLMLDVDRFKAINDSQGHAAGDRALTGLANWLRDAVRAEDLLYRYGGDEFVLVLPYTTPTGAAHLADRIRATSPIAISVGAATAVEGDTPATLLNRADETLRAKKRGWDQARDAKP